MGEKSRIAIVCPQQLRNGHFEEENGDDVDKEITEQPIAKMCKFCYSDEIANDVWMHPCRCSGSMKWVHGRCFSLWLRKAPPQQQNQCLTCRFVYQKYWVLKSFADWCRPPLALTGWEIFEIFLDAYSTFKFIRGLIWTIDGKRSFLVQMAHFFFWRTFIATDRRMVYYGNLGRTVMSSVFDITVKNYEKSSENSTNDSIMAIENEMQP
ncbi:unnamed protein product, partial [Mesorhabditis belari]|uniref:RING-CH-type domain-containing protein n=1 Tax=Mesorhabditis belari TaxID=2138241 RepID=A0AAF3EZV0_9BILA